MKHHKIKNTVLFGLFLLSCNLFGQQEIQKYMFNPGVVNPAYAGSRDALNAVVDYRQQWVGWDGAPKTLESLNLTLTAPVNLQTNLPAAKNNINLTDMPVLA